MITPDVPTRPRIAYVYDALFPWTVGGAERWLTRLASFAAEAGYEVTYLTRQQWRADEPPAINGVRVVAVSPDEPLYREDGSRTLREPVRFGHGVYRYLRRHRNDFDLVHAHAFPYFGALGVHQALRKTSVPIVVDWAELWTRDYWRAYAGPVAGEAGWRLQNRVARIPQHALIPSRLHLRRLLDAGVNGPVTLLSGQFDGEIEPLPRPAASPPTVVFAGRHIPEKRVLAVPAAIELARREVPELCAVIFGDGPDQEAVVADISLRGLADVISTPGFVPREEIDEAIGSATCLLHPSEREGYGMVVVEAAAKGTPSIVVRGPDNAATDLVEDEVNGFIAPSADPETLAGAIIRTVREGAALRERTAAWANAHGRALTIEGAMDQVLEVYERALAR